MTLSSLIGSLHCPYCGSGLTPEQPLDAATTVGVVRCACYRYPLLDGILVLRQYPGYDAAEDPAVADIEAGRADRGLQDALRRLSPIVFERGRQPLATAVLRRLGWTGGAGSGGQASESLRDVLKRYRPGSYADYLYHRHANASFLASVPLISLFDVLHRGASPRPCLLDLNCGVGHATFLMQALFPSARVLACDHDFVNLWLARHYFAPGATLLCLDSECPLPFNDGLLDGVLCLDGLHYVRSKRALVRELRRASSAQALWLFAHLHNALEPNVAPGIPLRPEDYRRCFDGIPSRLMVEAQVLDRFVDTGQLDLRSQAPPAALEPARALSLAATTRTDVFDRAHRVDGPLLGLRTGLAVNPIYTRQAQVDGVVHLERRWPSERLERECAAAVERFLPPQLMVDAALIDALTATEWPAGSGPEVERLIRSFAFVHLPPGYRPAATASPWEPTAARDMDRYAASR